MDASELPTDVEQLKALLVSTLAVKERELKQARFEATQFKHEVNELSSSVAEQEKKLSAREQTIRELLAAFEARLGSELTQINFFCLKLASWKR